MGTVCSHTCPTTRPTDAKPAELINTVPFVRNQATKVQDVYQLCAGQLGQGSFGCVKKATHKVTGAVRAIKTMVKKTELDGTLFQQEIDILKTLDHPSIVKLYEVFEDGKSVHLVMELCAGGELLSRIIADGRLTEAQAAAGMQQVFRAVHYMHGVSICHRDLKLENFLLANNDPLDKNIVKIVDFGFSCRCKERDLLTEQAGTPLYVAPEVLAAKYSRSCDLWSLGVCLFILLSGYPPFAGRSNSAVLKKVRRGHFEFREAEWRHVSKEAKELIRSLLNIAPERRLTTEQALKHPWLRSNSPRLLNAGELPLGSSLMTNLREFQHRNKFAQMALYAIAGQLAEPQIESLRNMFVALDTNGDGILTVGELRGGIEHFGHKVNDFDLREIIQSLDSDGNGAIDYTEFLAATLQKQLYLQKDIAWRAFCVFDLDGDGKLSHEEIRQALDTHSRLASKKSGASSESGPSLKDGEGLSGEQTAEIVRAIDRDGDGNVDFMEFMAMLRHKEQNVRASEKRGSFRSSEKRSSFRCLGSTAR